MGDRLAAWVSHITDRVFGPVFTLDATRVGRRQSTFVMRWMFLSFLLFVLGMFFYSWQRDLPDGVVHPSVLTRFAENFFWVYSVTQFLVIATLTPAFTAAAITDEKERKTLHFLLVTDLSGREIIFGKLAARVGALLTLVIAGLPIVSFMQFFGGIEPQLLFVSVSMTTISVVSLTAVSIAASVLMARTRDALLLAYAVPGAYMYLSVSSLLEVRRLKDPRLVSLIQDFSAGNPFHVADSLTRGTGSIEIPPAAIWYLVFHALVAVVGIAIAALRIRASVRREGATSATPKGPVGLLIAWAFGKRSKARYHPPVSDTPIAWREKYVEPGSTAGIFHRLFTLGILGAIFFPFLSYVWELVFRDLIDAPAGYRYRTPWKEFQDSTRLWVCMVTCLFGVLMILRSSVRGASSVASERDRDTWVSLICTPLPVREILKGKWAGSVWQPDAMILLGIVWGIGVMTLSINPLALIPAGVALAAYLNAFAWMGINHSADARSSRIAIGQTVPLAILLVGAFWFFGMCCCAVAAFGVRGDVAAIPATALASATPAIVLGFSPAISLEALNDLSLDSRGWVILFSVVGGYVAGIVGWVWAAKMWADKAHEKFAVAANRDEEMAETIRERYRRVRQRPTPGDSSNTWGSS